MRVMNVMLGRCLGGLEQALLERVGPPGAVQRVFTTVRLIVFGCSAFRGRLSPRVRDPTGRQCCRRLGGLPRYRRADEDLCQINALAPIEPGVAQG